MNHSDPRPDPRYTPYQAEFFHRFVAEIAPGSVHLLLAPVGAGKSFAMAGSISELARTGRVQRVLVLTPAALADEWAYLLGDSGPDAVVIDGRTLRLLREQTGGAPGQWPTGVYAMSIDLAKRPDVEELLVAIPWDLVAVDEAHSLTVPIGCIVDEISGLKLDTPGGGGGRRP